MVVENAPTGVGTALPRPGCHGGSLRPSGFDALAISAAGPFRVCKVVVQLTFFTVSGEMELQNNNLPVLKVRQSEGRKGTVVPQTCLETFVPLARDVIRNENSGYSGIQGWDQG